MGFKKDTPDTSSSKTKLDKNSGEGLDSKKVGEILLQETPDDVDQSDIKESLEDIMDEFEVISSQLSASYLYARRHDIPLNDKLDTEVVEPELEVANIVPRMNNLTLKARIDRIHSVNTFERGDGSEGRVRNIDLSDDPDTRRKVQVSLWDEDTELADQLSEGDVVLIEGGYTKENDYRVDVYGDAEIGLNEDACVYVLRDGERVQVR